MERIYLRPANLSEALKALSDGKGTILAGGTDLLVEWRKLTEAEKPNKIVDISAVTELKGVTEIGNKIKVGAMTTHREVVKSPIIEKYAPNLCEAAFSVGSTQIRNRGTVGGSLGNSSPAADLSPVWVLLDAVLEVQSESRGSREVAVKDFLKGYGKNDLVDDELIVDIIFEKPSDAYNFSFVKIGRRNAVAIARLNGACMMSFDGEKIADVKLVIGAATPSPLAMNEEVKVLVGKTASRELFAGIGDQTVERVKEISGVRASAKWKFPAVDNLAVKLLVEAAKKGGRIDE